jgi:cytochrome c2
MIGFVVAACGSKDPAAGNNENKEAPKSMVQPKKVDDGKGVGEVKHVDLNDPLDATMVSAGKNIYELKCSACHKLSDQRVVGPGWKGVTDRRKPEWIMNMTLNADVMLEKDPEAQKMLKECLVRMPNQNLSMEESRSVLEFMFSNDQGS